MTNQNSYDYVIVGAGPAGCVLAGRLAERAGTTVAVLEAGGPNDERGTRVPGAFPGLLGGRHDWNFTTVPQAGLLGRTVTWPRGKIVGGSAAVNAQMWVRGNRLDYDEWGADVPGWSFADVLPYFHRVEARVGSNSGGVYGTDGPQWITDLRDPNPTRGAFLVACDEVGLRQLPELNAYDNSGFAPTPVTQWRGRRWTAADGYLEPAVRRGSVQVITDAHARRVLLDGHRATGVEYQDPAGRILRVHARREVVLSAGAVGSPHLLQLSGIGPRDQLAAAGVPVRHELSGVGANLTDHAMISLYHACPKPVTLASANSLANRIRYAMTRRGPLASNIAEAMAFIRSDLRLPAPDIELIWAPRPYAGPDAGAPAHGVTLDVILLRPDSTGAVTLTSADPAQPPRIDPAYLSADADLHRYLAGLRFAERILASEALRPFVAQPMWPYPGVVDDETLAHYVRSRLTTIFHPVGTCRMGTDDGAVVDPEMRVHGVESLRVVDASVMPRLNRGHPLAPVMMLAERAAELISTDGQVAPRGSTVAAPGAP